MSNHEQLSNFETKFGLPNYSGDADNTPQSFIEAADNSFIYKGHLEGERRTVKQILGEELLTVICRNCVYPTWNSIGILDKEKRQFTAMSVARLFKHLGKTEEELREVYEYGEIEYLGGEKRLGYTGDFTQDGRQRLADIVGKPIHFRLQPDPEPILASDPVDDPDLDPVGVEIYRKMYPEWGVFYPRKSPGSSE